VEDSGEVPDDPRPIVVGRLPLAAGCWVGEHAHPAHHQLNWTARGVLGVAVGDRSWVLPPTLALWLPAGTPHRTGATRDAVLRSLYIAAELPDLGDGEPVAVAVDPLLTDLAAHLTRDLDPAARRRAEAVVPDVLRPLPTAPVEVPEPVDPRARAVAAVLWRDPADPRGLAELAAGSGTSRRTLSRLFVAETGLAFERWRAHLRVRAALPLLAEGQGVARVARPVGYSTPSAFLAAFRRVVGTTPGRYLGVS
jgi:AraC-like DNA-binding protein/quercetin dioxygenase-like cupin family protein